MLPILYLLLFLLTRLPVRSDFIQPLTRIPVQPYAINQGYLTDYAFHVNIPSTITYNGYIIIEFPSSFQLSATCVSYIDYQENGYQTYPCSKISYNSYSIQAGSIPSGSYEIILTGIQNPQNDISSSTFKISTWIGGLVPVDSNEHLSGIPFTPKAGTSLNATFTNVGYSNVYLGSKFNFKFSLKTAISAGGSIKFNFPLGFTLSKPACFHKNSGSYAIATTLYNSRMVLCQAFEYEFKADIWHEVLVIGLTNPDHTGYYRPFSLETFEGTTPNVLEYITIPFPAQIIAGNIQTTIQTASNLLARNTTHQFDFIPDDPLPADTQFWIKFPAGFRYLASNCTLGRPMEPSVSGGTVSCGLASNRTGYIIQGFAPISAKQQITVIFNVENPSVSTNYNIQAFTFSTNNQAIIDEVVKTIYIEKRYGSAKFFQSHALLYTRRLMHNEIGPLEFTFFLTVPLSATTGTFLGKIIVDIRPQLAYPPGSLKCLFYGDVPATSCSWDTSYYNKTRIIITTPVNMPYYQTELPITITSEDSVGYLGVQLLPLIQRYKFYIYFFSASETVEHEVYFEDYVPNPIYIDNTWITSTVAPMEYSETSYIRIDFTNKYMDLGTNYFIRLEFDHSNLAWHYWLGWSTSLQWYQIQYIPCIIVGLGSDYKCTLKPGGAANSFSYIKIWGISAIPYNTAVQIHIPRIRFGSSGSAKMNFVLYENTPAQNTLFIPILVHNFTFTPTTYTSITASTFTTLSLANNKPDATSQLSVAWTSTANNPEYIIVTYPSLFVKDTGIYSCTGGTCIVFASTVNWIVFKPSPLQGTTASMGMTLLSAPYEGSTYTFAAKTSQAMRVRDRKQQTFTLNPGALYSISWTTNPSNPEINKNSFVLFDLSFNLATKLPTDSSILITFTNLQIPTGTDFYCQINAGLSGKDTRDVTCEATSTTVLKIYNLAATAIDTSISLTLQLLTATATSVSALINTYYERTATNRVDTGTTPSLTLTFNYDNFFAGQVYNDKSGFAIKAGVDAGIVSINFVPRYSYASSVSIKFTFQTGFQTASSSDNDVLMCRLNSVRYPCSYTTAPLEITVTSLGAFTAGTTYKFTLTTEYEDPGVRGIKAPPTAGYYTITAQLYDNGNFLVETIQDFIYIYPNSQPSFQVSAAHLTASTASLYYFQFILLSSLPSNTHATTRGRIFIDFPVGTGFFLADLGTGLSTGNAIGCNIAGDIYPTTSIRCRIFCSPGNNLPASIELTGFNAFTGPTGNIYVRVMQVKNPSVTNSEITFAIRTETITVATGVTTPIEYRQATLWNQVVTHAIDNTAYNAATAPTFEAGSTPGNTGKLFYIYMYSKVALSAGDHYIYTFPSVWRPSATLSCPSYVDLCMYFADTNTVVYRISTSLLANYDYDGRISTMTIPTSYSPTGYTIVATIWAGGRMSHQVSHVMTQSYLWTMGGPISSASFAALDSNQLVQNRDNTDIMVTFTTYTSLPSTGSIVITFPAGTVPRMGCRNVPTMGSTLTASTPTFGQIACAIQSNAWVITNFATLSPGIVKIYGQVLLPSSSGTTTTGTIYTYSNQDSAIATNGMLVDRIITGLTLTIANYATLSLDFSPTFKINRPTRASSSNYQAISYDFRLRSISITTNGYIQLIFPYSSTSYFGYTVASGASYACSFANLATGAVTACLVNVATTVASYYFYFNLYPRATLSPGTNYRLTLSTQFANSGNDGVYWPSVASEYGVTFDAYDNSQSPNHEYETTFIEILPAALTTCVVKSYVIQKSALNVIDIAITGSFTTAHRVVIEFPTLFNSTQIWQDDLGLGINNYDLKVCEKLSTTPISVTFSCFFQKGNAQSGDPARIVLYGISASASALRFAFTAYNPAVTVSTILPLAIYVTTGTWTSNYAKVYYNYIEKAIPVSADSAPSAQTDYTTPSFGTSRIQSTTTLNVGVTFGSTMTNLDYYLIFLPALGVSVVDTTITTVSFGGVTWNLIYLPLSRIIVLNPQSSIGGGSYSFTTSSFIPTQDWVLLTASLTFSGHATYHSQFYFQSTNYAYTAASLTSKNSFTGFTTSMSPSTIYRYNYGTLTMTINTQFRFVLYLRIDIPTDFTIGVDCYEGAGNAIPVQECIIDSANNRALVTLESQTYSSSAQNLILVFPDLYANNNGGIGAFKLYLFNQIKASFTDSSFAVYEINSINANPSISISALSYGNPSYLNVEYVPYVENLYTIPQDSYGELKFTYTPDLAITSGFYIYFKFSGSNMQFDNWDYGDCDGNPLLIIYNPNDISGGYDKIIGTYSSGLVTFIIPSTISLSSGRQNTFRLTQACKVGDVKRGLRSITSGHAKVPIYMEIANSGGTLLRTGLVNNIWLGTTLFTVVYSHQHDIPGEVNLMKLTITVPASVSSIDNFYIEFPPYDYNDNTAWDSATLGGLYVLQLLPCGADTTYVGTANGLRCIFMGGTLTRQDPPTVWVKGITASASASFDFYMWGYDNPSASRVLTLNLRFYSGATMVGHGYTNTVQIGSSGSGYSSIVTSSGSYIPTSTRTYPTTGGTYNFRAGTAATDYIIVKYDSSCTFTTQNNKNWDATGSDGKYILWSTTGLSAGGTYTTGTQLSCPYQTQGLQFTQWHLSSSTRAGEIRTGTIAMSDSARKALTGTQIDLSSPSVNKIIVSSIRPSLGGVTALIQLNIAPMASKVTSTFKNWIFTLESNSLYFSSFSSCVILRGLVPLTPNQGVTCSIASTTMMKISDFKSIDTSTYLVVMLTFTTASSFGSGYLGFYGYGNQNLYSNLDYSFFAYDDDFSVSNPTGPNYYSSFSIFKLNSVPTPYISGQTIRLEIQGSGFPTSLQITDGNFYLKIQITSIGGSVFTGSSSCTPVDTNEYRYCYCTTDVCYAYFQQNNNWPYYYSISSFPVETFEITNTNWPDLGPYMVLYEVYDNSGTLQFRSNTMSYSLGDTSFNIDSDSCCNSISVSTLHRTNNAYNEYRIVMASPIPITTSTSFSVYFTHSTLRPVSYGQTDCICSVGGTSVTVSCYKGTGNYIDFYFTSTINRATAVTCYLPDIRTTTSTETVTIKVVNLLTRDIFYTSSGLSVSLNGGLTSNQHTLDLNLPGLPMTLPTTGSRTVSFTAANGVTVLNGMIYVDVGMAGPIPSCSCASFTACRCYNTVRRIFITPIDNATALLNYGIYSTSAGWGYYTSDTNSNYSAISYLIGSDSYIKSWGDYSGTATNWNPQAITTQTAFLSENRQGYSGVYSFWTRLPNTITIQPWINSIGGRLVYTLTGPTSVSSTCIALAGKVPITCTVSGSGPYTITLTHWDTIAAQTYIDVMLRGTNPTSSTVGTVTLKAWGYYDSSVSSYTQVAANLGSTNYFTFLATGGTVVSTTNFGIDPFFTISVTSTSCPIRVKFKLTQSLTSSDYIVLSMPSSYTYNGAASLVCVIRTFQSGNVYNQDLDYVERNVSSCSISSYSITIYPSTTLAANVLHQVIVGTTSTVSIRDFTILSSSTSQADIYFVRSGSVIARQFPFLYQYLPSTSPIDVTSSFFYYTSKNKLDFNNIFLALRVQSTIAVYPTSIIEVVFTTASSNKVITSTSPRTITCSLFSSAGFTPRTGSPSSVINTRCVLINTTPPKIRIENYNALTSTNTYWLVFYDLENSLIANAYYGGFSCEVQVRNGNNRWIYPFEGMFYTSGSSATTITSSTGAFPTSSSQTTYRTSSNTLTSPSLSVAACTNCRVIARLESNYALGASSCDFQVSGSSQTTTFVDIYNKYLIVLSTSWSAATRTFGVSGGNFWTPYPFESTAGTYTVQTFDRVNFLPSNKYTFSTGSGATLSPDSNSVSGDCNTFYDLSGKYGRIQCYYNIYLTGRSSSPSWVIDQVQMTFSTTSQWTSFQPYCRAFINSGSYQRGQISCSRADTTGTAAVFNINGFTYGSGNYIQVYFRFATSTTNSITALIEQQILKSGVYYDASSSSHSITLTSTSAWSSSYFAPSSVIFYESVPRSLGTSVSSPIRVALTLPATLSSGRSITFSFSSSSNYQPLSSIQILCTMRSQSTFALPIMTLCSYSSGTYTLTTVTSVASGRYLVEITNLFRDVSAAQGTAFPSNTGLTTLTVTVDGTYTDAIKVAPTAPAFNTFSISLKQANAASQTRLYWSFTVPTAVSSDASQISAENVIGLEFPTTTIGFWDSDLGASTATYAAEGIPYFNGINLPATLSGISANSLASLVYGTSTTPAYIYIRGHSGTSGTQSYTFGYIKVPPAQSASYARAFVYQYSTSSPLPIVIYEYTAFDFADPVSWSESYATSRTMSISNRGAEQATSITFSGKDYETTINTAVVVYMKFKNRGSNFDYQKMSSLICTGYTTEWYKWSYIAYLTPTGSYGTTPSITCSGFILGTSGTVTIETGVYRSTFPELAPCTWTNTITSFTPGSDTSSAYRVVGTSNIGSVNTYAITYHPGTFYFDEGSYIDIILPSGYVSTIAGRTDSYFYVGGGLKDGTVGSLQGTLVSGNVRVRGFGTFNTSDATIVFQLVLINVNNINTAVFYLRAFTSAGTQYFQSQPIYSFTISGSPAPASSLSIVSYLTDDVLVTVGQQWPIKFVVRPKTAITFAGSGRIYVTLPSSFSISYADILCKYSYDGGANWVRSPTCSISSQVITIPVVSGFDIPAFTSNNALNILISTVNYTVPQGVWRADIPTLYTFNVKTQQSGTVRESVWLPLVVNPASGVVNPYWISTGSNDMSVIEVNFTADQDYLATDVFNIKFVTNNELSNMWPISFGQSVAENRMIAVCGQFPISTVVSNNVLLNCYYTQGSTSTSPQTSAQITVKNEKFIPAGSVIWFYIVNIQNPTSGAAGWEFSISRKCRDDGMVCPRFYKRYYQNFGPFSGKTANYWYSSGMTLQTGKTNLLETGVKTTFTISLSADVSSLGCFILKTTTSLVYLVSQCVSSVGNCINFPTLGWSFLKLNTTLTSGYPRAIDVLIDNAQYFDRTYPIHFTLDVFTNQKINQIYYFYHPNYALRVPPMTTNSTQTDYDKQYIVRMINNILIANVTNIWRTALSTRVIFNIPSSFPGPIDDYCFVGVNISDISSVNYHEFPCRVSSTRQITFVFTDPYQSGYENDYVVIAYRAFMLSTNPTGMTTTSTITSYAHISNNWIIDQNTQYQFYISPTPTPTLRDVNLNLKSVFDLTTGIGDLVMFYGAIWPNTAQATNQITSVVFQVADEYGYPAVSSLSCSVKRIFTTSVPCTLLRTLGQTLVTMTLTSYDHGPFLIRITNTNQNQLFTAPTREGNFLFNLTFANSSGAMVEQADSYTYIGGVYLSYFRTYPILNDPLNKTMWIVEFVTTSRVTPQGYDDGLSTVTTAIYLSYQTYSPAFPVDLGSGLANNSRISCLAVSGLRFTVKGKPTCTLIIGTSIVNTVIKVTGYDPIGAYTTVKIHFDDIATMALGATSRIQLYIKSLYSGDSENYIFYNSLQVSPPLNPTALNILTLLDPLIIERSGSLVIKTPTTYNFTFTLNTNLTANKDYIIIEFPLDGYELDADYSNVQAAIYPSKTSKSYVMNLRNIIYVMPTQQVLTGTTSVVLSNLPNPSYFINSSQVFYVKTVVENKTTELYNTSMFLQTDYCTLFSGVSINYLSKYTLINENTYTFNFTTEHYIPTDGSISLIFDPALYNLRASNPTCELVSGFPKSATCSFELYAQQLVRITLNGNAIDSGTKLSVNINNVNNPTTANVIPEFKIQSNWDSIEATTKVICSSTIRTEAFGVYPVMSCPVSIAPDTVNTGSEADFTVTLKCAAQIRNATVITVTLPSNIQGFSSRFACNTNGNYLMTPCYNIPRTSDVLITIYKPNPQKDLIIRIRGVIQSMQVATAGPMNVNFVQYTVTYGQTDTANSILTYNVIESLNYVKYTDNAKLNAFPANYAEQAIHFFKIMGLNFKAEPSSLKITFPTSFTKDIGSDLECGTFTPDSRYTGIYTAMNFETMADWAVFNCSVVDDYLLFIEIPSTFTFVDKKNLDFYFYVDGIINPSSGSSFYFVFDFYASDKVIILTSTNSITLALDTTPYLLKLASVSSNDNNVLAVTNYTFVINSSYSLPFAESNDTKEYEIVIKMPKSQYSTITNYRTPITYAFSDQSLNTGSAFNFKNSIFFYADYPDLKSKSPLSLMLSNITNPSSQIDCSFDSTTAIHYEVQYVSRLQGKVYAKTYPAMDQSNCLSFSKTKFTIDVSAAYYMVRGLSYQITISLEQPTSGLRLIPYSKYIIFNPSEVNFTDFLSSTATLNAIIPSDLPTGDYVIRWTKIESGVKSLFLEVPNTIITIVPNSVLAPLPTITIESFNYVWTGSLARDILVTLDQDPASELIINIGVRNADTRVQGSLDNVIFTNFPIQLRFVRGETKKRFYIWADSGAQSNYLQYTLSGVNSDVFNPSIPDTPYMVMTPLASGSIQIVNTQITARMENAVSVRVTLSGLGTIYYAAVIKTGLVIPTHIELISSKLSINSKWYSAGEISVERLGDGNSYTVNFNLTGLYSQTSYVIFFLARSTSGLYSDTVNMTFSTLRVSPGASIKVPTSQPVNASALQSALSSVLSIPSSRLILKQSEEYSSSSQNYISGTSYSSYTFIIAPDPSNNDPTPLGIAETLGSANSQSNLKLLVPQFYSNVGVKTTQVVHIPPRILASASVLDIGYYSLSIKMELIEEGKGYALVTENTTVGNTKPTSYQIAHGLLADNSQSQDRYFIKASTDENGAIKFVFDELKDNTTYNVYITASNNVPYEPADLLSDESVMSFQITTVANPNFMDSLELEKYYSLKNSQFNIDFGVWLLLVVSILLMI